MCREITSGSNKAVSLLCEFAYLYRLLSKYSMPSTLLSRSSIFVLFVLYDNIVMDNNMEYCKACTDML